MSLLEFFRPQKKTSASLAKERLQIIVAERRSQNDPAPSYLPQLKEDILKVISKYVAIDPSMVDDISVLELNVKLPDEEK